MESHIGWLSSEEKLVKTVSGRGGRRGQFDWSYGIALSKDNKLFVCDKNNHRIQVFDTNLKFISCFGKFGSSEGEFRWPYDLTFDPAGDVYVRLGQSLCPGVFTDWNISENIWQTWQWQWRSQDEQVMWAQHGHTQCVHNTIHSEIASEAVFGHKYHSSDLPVCSLHVRMKLAIAHANN